MDNRLVTRESEDIRSYCTRNASAQVSLSAKGLLDGPTASVSRREVARRLSMIRGRLLDI